MSIMEKAFFEEITYRIEILAEENQDLKEKLESLTMKEIKKITEDFINDGWIWSSINEMIDNQIKDKIESLTKEK